MKKKISVLLIFTLILTMCASVMVSYAAEPIVYDFTQNGIACQGDAVSGNAQFFGKAKRFDYAYVYGVSKLIYTGTDGLNNPYLTNPSTNIDAGTYKYIKIAYWTKAGAQSMKFFFNNGSGISEANSIAAPITTDGTWQYAILDMTTVAGWQGTINEIRYDFLYGGEFAANDYVYCGYIAAFDTKEAAEGYQKTLPDMAAYEADPDAATKPGFTLNNTKYDLGDDFSITLTFKNAPFADSWFGIYPASAPEAITSADSIGVWFYMNGNKTVPTEVIPNGTLTLTKEICDEFSKLAKGDYKIVMFKGGSPEDADVYAILDTQTFSFVEEGTAPAPIDPTPDQPTPGPSTGDAGLLIIAAAAITLTVTAVIRFKKRSEA